MKGELVIHGESHDRRVLASALRKLVRNPLNGILTEEETAQLGDAMAARFPQATASDVLCEHCKKAVSKADLVGSLLAQEVWASMEEIRRERGIVTLNVAPGQPSRLEFPEGYDSYRVVNMGHQRVESAGPAAEEALGWSEASSPARFIYPPEFYLHETILFSDKVLCCGPEATIESLRHRIRELLASTRDKEMSLWGAEDPSKVRRVCVRKKLDSRSIDMYNMGRPEYGWFFETIISMTEFA